jgi:hypothetical protein
MTRLYRNTTTHVGTAALGCPAGRSPGWFGWSGHSCPLPLTLIFFTGANARFTASAARPTAAFLGRRSGRSPPDRNPSRLSLRSGGIWY